MSLKISDYVIILGVLILSHSIPGVASTINFLIWCNLESCTLDWSLADTLWLLYLIFSPIVIFIIACALRQKEREKETRDLNQH